MNILLTSTSYKPAPGGAQTSFHDLARALAERGNNVRVASFWDRHRTDWLLGTTLRAPSCPKRYDIDGVSVQQLGVGARQRLQSVPAVLGYIPFQRWSVRWLSHLLLSDLWGIMPDVELVHNNRIGREPITMASLMLARQRQVPFVLSPHHHPRWTGWRYRTYIDLYKQSDALIAMTAAERETFTELGVDPERVHVVGASGVVGSNPQPDRFRKQYGITGPMILFVGQKYPYKGIDLILDAAPLIWRTRPEAQFVFIGPQTTYSRDLFSKVSDRRIIEVGPVSLDEKTDAMAACDIFCMPSGQEAFGLVFLEAWMLGKPVIAADIPAERELISNGRDGFLVERTVDHVVRAIADLLDNPELRTRMGHLGQEKVMMHYTMDRVIDRVLVAYESAARSSQQRIAKTASI